MAENEAKIPTTIALADIIPQVTQDVVSALRQQAINTFGYSVREAAQAEVTKFIEAEVMPLVRAELKDKTAEIKAAMVAGIYGACIDAAEAIRKAMTTKLAGYEGDKFIGQILEPMIPKRY